MPRTDSCNKSVIHPITNNTYSSSTTPLQLSSFATPMLRIASSSSESYQSDEYCLNVTPVQVHMNRLRFPDTEEYITWAFAVLPPFHMTSWTLTAKLERDDLLHFACKVVRERCWQLYDGKLGNVPQRARLCSVRNGLSIERERHIELGEVDSHRKVRDFETGFTNFFSQVITPCRIGGWK